MPAPGTISVKAERELILLAQRRLSVDPKDPDGIDARNRVIEANLRLACLPLIAAYCNAHSIDHEETVQWACFGLARAVMDFNPQIGKSFSTYAVWKIRGVLSAFVGRRGRVQEFAFGVYDIVSQFDDDCSDSRVSFMQSIPDHRSVEVEEIDEELERDRVRAVIVSWAASRDPILCRYAVVLRLRFGLDGVPQVTLEETGRSLGISKERARQLQKDALLRFREDYEALGPENFPKEMEVSLARA